MGLPATFGEILSEEKSPSRAKPARSTKVVYPPDAIFPFASRRYIPCLSITRGGTDKGKRSGRVDAERGKRTWKWEGGRDSGLPPRTRVGGSAKNAVVEHVEMCTALDAWMSRAVASTRLLLPVSTFHYYDSLLAGAAARQAPTESPQTSGNSHTSAIPTLVRRELKFPEVSERPHPSRYLRS